jgi:hypothetical protein
VYYLYRIIEDATKLAKYLALFSDPFVERNMKLLRSWREGCVLFIGIIMEEEYSNKNSLI